MAFGNPRRTLYIVRPCLALPPSGWYSNTTGYGRLRIVAVRELGPVLSRGAAHGHRARRSPDVVARGRGRCGAATGRRDRTVGGVVDDPPAPPVALPPVPVAPPVPALPPVPVAPPRAPVPVAPPRPAGPLPAVPGPLPPALAPPLPVVPAVPLVPAFPVAPGAAAGACRAARPGCTSRSGRPGRSGRYRSSRPHRSFRRYQSSRRFRHYRAQPKTARHTKAIAARPWNLIGASVGRRSQPVG